MRRSELKKLAAAFVCAAVAFSIFAGCGNASEDSDTVSDDIAVLSDEEGSSAGTDGEHEALTMLTGQIDYKIFIDALHEKYPEINIEMVSYCGGNTSGYMKQSLEVGDIPDIYSTNYNTLPDKQAEYLLDLSQYSFVNNYTDVMLNDVDVDGRIYILPSRYTVGGIYYNKTMFEEHGWSVPESFDELVALCEQITEETGIERPVESRANLAGYLTYYFFSMNSTGFFGTPAGEKWKSDFLTGDTTAVGNIEECAEYFQKWVDAGFFSEDELNAASTISDRFYGGEIPIMMGLSTTSFTGTDADGNEFEVGIMPWFNEDGSSKMIVTNVSRYFGLNAKLAEPGNEQKLEDALKVMEFMATQEGQSALASGYSSGVVFPIKDFKIDEDSPLYEIHDLIEGGYTTPLVYTGWVDRHLYPLYDELVNMLKGEITAAELPARMDAFNAEIQADPDRGVFAYADETLTKEQCARLTGIAMCKYLDTDVALVSLGDVYDISYENIRGANSVIYEGPIDDEKLNVFRPWGWNMEYIDLTGAEIKKLYEDGKTMTYTKSDGTSVQYIFPYVLTVRDDAELDDDTIYTIAFNYADYNTGLNEEWGDRLHKSDDNTGTAIKAYLEEIGGHLSADKLVW